MKTFFVVFISVFLAELADKTQFAIFSFATSTKSKWLVFLGAIAALSLTSLLAVAFGETLSKFVPFKILKVICGIIFIAIGIFVLVLKD